MHASLALRTALLMLTLAACGGATSTSRRGSAPPEPAPPPPAARTAPVELWSQTGVVVNVNGWGATARDFFAAVQHRGAEGWQQRLYRVDRETGEVTSIPVDNQATLIRTDPLILDLWDGELARWRGTRIVRLADSLAPVWSSERMNISLPHHRGGELVIVERGQAGEYVGLDPADGRVAFRLRTEPDGIFNEAVEAESFIAVPAEDRAILVDRQSGEISAVVEAEFGGWEIVGDHLVAHFEDRLVAYDGQGREVWRREGEFPVAPARTVMAWSPSDGPARSPLLVVWQRGHGLVALDSAGAVRWTHGQLDEERWGYVQLYGRYARVMHEGIRTVLDRATGALVFECGERCTVLHTDDEGLLVAEPSAEGAPVIALYDVDGARRWTHPLGGRDVEHLGLAMAGGEIALCDRERGLTFLDRADGAELAHHALPPVGDPERTGSPQCSVGARDGLFFVQTEARAALYGPAPARPREQAVASIAASSESTAPADPSREPSPPSPSPEDLGPREFYVIAAQAPPAAGPLPGYAAGREAYRSARALFEAERFAEAATGFVEAYRVFFATGDPDLQRLGLECCYDARVSLDRAGGGDAAREAFVAQLPAEDERCGGIVTRAPRP